MLICRSRLSYGVSDDHTTDEVVPLIQPRHHCILREKVREQVQCYNKCFQMGLAGTTTLADDALFPSSTAAFRGSETLF